MLISSGRVLTRAAGLSALQSLPAYKAVIPVGKFIPRGLATTTAPKKAASSSAVSKKTTITTKAAKAPVKPTAASTTKKAAPVAPKVAVEPTEKSSKKSKKTEEEKQKENIKSLLEKALDPPPLSTKSIWIWFLKDKFESCKGTGENVATILKREHKNWVNEYKNLAPADLQALQAKAEMMSGNAGEAFANWVKQHSPAEIRQANLARAALRNIKAKSDPVPRGLKSNSFAAIPDDRFPLRARSANILYIKEKFASLPKEKRADALPALMKEYTALPESEKQKWKALSAKDLVRYHNQLKDIGIEPPSTSA
ncbi:hypothetical protein L211DRAFT_833429 [Terfezia boudieri ATCC MYA-4762]|uniref:HMG box domain-containing protein n=1 Tax=Terfezia boudieri ATCC MYA-4762 TaxID=1051890 RepID=A0A3N4LZV0_9PEZI|nr:hypothetical protein L211DRAFT_833429 [Terfezia boudieri ATCC MYA-4762]